MPLHSIHKGSRYGLRIIAVVMLLLAGALTFEGYAQRTTRKGLRRLATPPSAAVPATDTVRVGVDDMILKITGYDKPLRSNYESMFVGNESFRDIKGLIVVIDYYDKQRRMLHSRRLTLKCDIPAGQTRQITFRTWDRQQSFYYHLSTKPRRADGTPFDVVVRPESVIVSTARPADSIK